jgi:phage gpG-like protein
MHYGLDKIDVPAHTKLINQAFGKKLKYPVYANVKAHTKKVNVKARPFLGIEKPQKRIIANVYKKFVDQITKGKQ